MTVRKRRVIAAVAAALLLIAAVAALAPRWTHRPSLHQSTVERQAHASSDNNEQAQYARRREAMVERQLRARGIEDEKVLRAMAKVPRHEFVPAHVRSAAYADRPLSIGEGQTISQPYIVALMTEVAKVKRGDKVLEIGTGSGYQAAVLAEITPEVYTIEILPSLAKRAEATLKRLGYDKVKVRIGDGYLGWEEHAPFDAVIVTCAPDHIPQPLADQLAEGGRIVIPVGEQEPLGGQKLMLGEKVRGELKLSTIAPVRFVPLVRDKGGS